MTCADYFFYDSTTSPQTSVSYNSGILSASDSLVVFGYSFCSTACDRSMTMTFGTNSANPDTCFVATANSPMKVGTNGVVYMWYCGQLTGTPTTLIMTCTNHTGTCGFLSFFAYQLTGGCTSTPCIDQYGLNDSTTSSIQSVTISTNSAVGYTKELSSAFCSNNNNENITVSSPYIAIYSSTVETTIHGNQIGALGIGTGVASATMTWTGNDGVICTIMTVKTPSSVAVSMKNAIPTVIGDVMPFRREVYAWNREDNEV